MTKKVEDAKGYKEAAVFIAELVAKKNISYGDSFAECGEILKILYPNGIRMEDYSNLLAIVRILDKMFRIATNDVFDAEEPWNDICGYALLKVAEHKSVNKILEQ